MSINSDLAACASWIRAEVERLPEDQRPDVAQHWRVLMNQVRDARSEGSALMCITQWRLDMAQRLKKEVVTYD